MANSPTRDVVMTDVDDMTISDDSDFYAAAVFLAGNDSDVEYIASLEAKCRQFSSSEWWAAHEHSLPRRAAQQQARKKMKQLDKQADDGPAAATSVRLHNIYEGKNDARQLSETVDEFLARLPPRSTRLSEVGPWIWIANPHPPTPRAPAKSDVSGFKDVGNEVLEAWSARRADIQRSMSRKAQSTVTRVLNKERREIETRLLALAAERGVTHGKWLLFPSNGPTLDETWTKVSHAVAAGQLGSAAKVATVNDGESSTASKVAEDGGRLICIYTQDFRDKDDVKRVLVKLNQLGLVGSGNKGIYYKSDAWTWLDLSSGNEHGFKARL
ncbi:MAG: hypothetical protein M1825_004214 [Sarcosagium campestre]|nr:MAG: hypothetical protein M1825_004214 [Sarcosagium campestre]